MPERAAQLHSRCTTLPAPLCLSVSHCAAEQPTVQVAIVILNYCPAARAIVQL